MSEDSTEPEIKSELTKDEEAQVLWEKESKRIQEIKNQTDAEISVNVISEDSTESISKEEADEEIRRLEEKMSDLNSNEPSIEKQSETVVEPTPEPEVPEIITETSYEKKIDLPEVNSAALLESVSDAEVNSRISFEEFTDERTLISHDAFGNKQMKIKVLEVSDEIPPVKWKFGDRVKVTKILVTIKHLSTQEVEEAEFDIEAIERELAEKRHYTSTNRWIPATDIKNGYVVGSKHTRLISDASALDYIVF